MFDEDKLQQQIIDASAMEPVDGAEPAVRFEFEDAKDTVSIEVIPYLNEWLAKLVLSNNFNLELVFHAYKSFS